MTSPSSPKPASDPRVPGYLGRILDGAYPVGSCFQVAPGVIATALHVLDDIDAGREGAVVRVDALAGGIPAFEATVTRTDALHDLAVLNSRGRLSESVAGWAATDRIDLTVPAVVTGVSVFPDEHTHRFLDAPGYWGGGTTRDDEIPLGRFVSSAVVRGMSGAPVRRLSDDVVIGVVSQRYNSADGWGRDSVWVARVEDLQPLLAEMREIAVTGPLSPTGAVEVVLTVTDARVRLHGTGIDVTAPHTGVRPGLTNAIAEVRRERTRLWSSAITRAEFTGLASETGAHSVSLRRAGELVADSFLPLPVSVALAQILTDAAAAHVPVRIGIEAGPFPGLPWEALPDPITRRPLVLHPLITVYRRVPAPPVRNLPAPLRILVAIAAPDEGSGPVLDYERELRNVLSAVRGARHRDAEVRIVEFATTAAIRAELAQAPAHILHLSGHGKPGCLLLEDETGSVREVDAEKLVAEAIPPGSMPPVISLAACYTDVAAEAAAPSFAAALIAHGASVVIGTETSVTDRYATALFARVYQELTQNRIPDVVTAVADARRLIHQQWSASTDPTEVILASMDEWSVVTVLADTGAVSVYDPAISEAVPPHDTVTVSGLPTRGVGEFVGRRREQRRLPAYLTGNQYPGVVLHGIGGVGKTTLAARIVHCQRLATVIPVVTGETNIDSLLSAVAGTIRRHCLIDDGAPRDPRVLRAAQIASSATETWQNRLTALRAFVFDRVPVLVVLDNFEDNLTDARSLSDPHLAALLSAWLADPGCSRLLVTSRYPFMLPDNAHHRLLLHQVGPLSRAETFKLIWSLPALDRLTVKELDHIWRLVGGHPRSLEYLDALLNNQIGRYHDITYRLEGAIANNPVARHALTALTLDTALAATVTLIADDILLDQLLGQLTPAAHQLLIGASVYREPVEDNALLYQIGTDSPGAARQPDYRALKNTIAARYGIDPTAPAFDLAALPQHVLDEIAPAIAEYNTKPRPPIATDADLGELARELASNSLLTIDPDNRRAFVHRSTAAALERSCAQHQRDDVLAAAHRRAATYWVWRVAAWPQDRDADLHDRLEARYHYQQTSNTAAAHDLTLAICDRLHTIGAWDHETTLIHDTLRHLQPNAPERAHWLHRLGMIAQLRGDYTEAEHQYQHALTIGEELGNRAGMATSYHQLGMISQLRGDYTEAEHGTAARIGDNRVGLPFGWAGRMSSCRSPIPVSSATMSCVWLAIATMV
ncbi:CHAT domain-containing protein [Nocardia sp. NBC_00508]|uniref:CHAT domain-containing protein n=1 Tax=Nocardia sp. NBC_00508 TaxID=2975992 RepID=UPI002E808AC0|nr:CHAT domain-containing protein [Nocardia sp. NBC_00508]WUD68234.1 CHAT domain-containing protein [Nocardia sp. NBC_00508]